MHPRAIFALPVIMALGLSACVQVSDQAVLTGNDGFDRNIKIVNATSATMTAFYGSHRETDNWEENILGDDVLEAGASVLIDFDEGNGKCVYDFRAEFADGGVNQEGAVNICKVGAFTFEETSN